MLRHVCLILLDVKIPDEAAATGMYDYDLHDCYTYLHST